MIALFSVVSGVVAVRTINGRVLEEAQTRVRLDLESVRDVFQGKLRELETVVRIVGLKESVVGMCRGQDWGNLDTRQRLERIRTEFRLDFLCVLTPDGRVQVRATPPYKTGDYRTGDPYVAKALGGEVGSGVSVWSGLELNQESEGLAERAFFELEETPHARKTVRKEETRGMVMVSAVPVKEGGHVTGVVVGGFLLSRNEELVDRMHSVVYKNERCGEQALGTATIFLNDCRIATTVRLANGNRALGTRVSKEVAERVLDNGQPWFGDAFVVRDWYITAYDALRNGQGQVIGMLYVGILKAPYVAHGWSLTVRYVVLSLIVLLLSLCVAFYQAHRLARPIHQLAQAAVAVSRGERPVAVPAEDAGCGETAQLIGEFNRMTVALHDREEKLKAVNKSYMATLGFVSHELKSPVAAIMNYVFLLKEGKLGAVTERQEKAIRSIDHAGKRLVEMVRHYLNLSRIENGELHAVAGRVAVWDEVVRPTIESCEPDAAEKRMRIVGRVAGDVVAHADLSLLREVFENLVGNGVKYGREGGLVEVLYRGRVAGLHEFGVRNEGDGIPADQLPLLFGKFSRLQNGGGRRQKGTGLGLFLAKSLVEAQGGQIRVESEPGQWVEFIFTVPVHEGGVVANGPAA